MGFNMNAIASKIEEAKSNPVSNDSNYAEVISKLKANDRVRTTSVHVVKCECNPNDTGDYYRLTLSEPVIRAKKDKRVPLADGTYQTTYKFEADTVYYLHKAVFARYFGSTELQYLAVAALNDADAFCYFMNNFDENDTPQGRDIELLQWFIDGNTTVTDPFSAQEFTPKTDTIQDFIGGVAVDSSIQDVIAANRAKATAQAKARLAMYLR